MPEFYLIPCVLAPDTQDQVIPEEVKVVIKNTQHFFVENVRSARRYISSLKLGLTIEELNFWIVDKKTDDRTIAQYIKEAKAERIGIISEAGCPGIADPGAKVVAHAHAKGYPVKPLVGPSSILLALIGSGFNGQQFTFHGYLPIDKGRRVKKIQELENNVRNRYGETQIFMETPFRNEAFFNDLVKTLSPSTKLCVAANVTADSEFIKTMTVKEWREKKPVLRKIPAIFLIGE